MPEESSITEESLEGFFLDEVMAGSFLKESKKVFIVMIKRGQRMVFLRLNTKQSE